MTLIETIKGIAFDARRVNCELLEGDWSSLSPKETKSVASFFNEVLTELLECAVNEGYISRDDLDGMKTYSVRQTFTFDFEIEAPTEARAREILEGINEHCEAPVMDVMINGRTEQVTGDFVEDTLEEERRRRW